MIVMQTGKVHYVSKSHIHQTFWVLTLNDQRIKPPQVSVQTSLQIREGFFFFFEFCCFPKSSKALWKQEQGDQWMTHTQQIDKD